MSQVQANQRRKPLRIDENKIKTLEVSEVEESERVEGPGVAPTGAVAVNVSSVHRASF